MLGLRKPIFKTKIIAFEKFLNAENCKRGPFLTSILLQNFKKNERGPFGDIKNFRKNLKPKKGEKSHSAEKSENLLLRNTCKKNLRIRMSSNTNPLG